MRGACRGYPLVFCMSNISWRNYHTCSLQQESAGTVLNRHPRLGILIFVWREFLSPCSVWPFRQEFYLFSKILSCNIEGWDKDFLNVYSPNGCKRLLREFAMTNMMYSLTPLFHSHTLYNNCKSKCILII